VNLINCLALICCENSALKLAVKWCVLNPLMARMNSSRKVLARKIVPFDLPTHSHKENAETEESAIHCMTTLFKDRLGLRSPTPRISI
jgi:hypothetical protein